MLFEEPQQLHPPVSGSEALKAVARFQSHIDSAAVLLSSAFAEASVTDFHPPQERHKRRQGRATDWYLDLVDTCLARSRVVRRALLHHWHPTPHAERLAVDAFEILADLTPSSRELAILCKYDRPKAFAALAEQLEPLTRQIELSAKLVADVESDGGSQPNDEQQFADLRRELLRKAGGGLSLTEAADLLGVSRQALHKRIKARSILGMMDGHKLVVPRGQFVKRGDAHEVLPGLAELLEVFATAGEWSALQFLVEPDPNLARPPLQALSDGEVARVLQAAKACAGADEI